MTEAAPGAARPVMEGLGRWPDRGSELLSRIPEWARVASLSTLFMVLAALSLRLDSMTNDEIAHLPAGFTYLDQRDYRLNPEHPPLAKMWAALPVWLLGLASPEYDSSSWMRGDEWTYGRVFCEGRNARLPERDPMTVLVPARLSMAFMGLAVGLVIYFWTREMNGPGAALLSFFFFTLSPTMLAHSRLVTTDIAAALGYVLTVWCFWRFASRPGWGRAAVLGIALGAALLLKYSTILLVPILAVLAAGWVMLGRSHPEGWRPRLVWFGRSLPCVVLAAFLCVWAGYGFRFQPTPDGSLQWRWRSQDKETGARAWMIRSARNYRLLPESYLYGMHSVAGGLSRDAYLNGKISNGWWQYFPEAFLLKTTPALLILFAWVVGAHFKERVRSPRPWTLAAWCIALPPTVYFAASMASRMNIGHRHLAPIYPFLFVLCGQGVRFLNMGRLRAALMATLIGTHAGSSATAFPNYLSYFNLAAGGTTGGWRYLVDSNLDWGQDLLRLKSWMESNRVEELHLVAALTSSNPSAYGVRSRFVYRSFEGDPLPSGAIPKSGDYFAVSATLRQGMFVDSREMSTFIRDIRARLTPVGRAGASFFIYRMP
jgi:hypothetical protein